MTNNSNADSEKRAERASGLRHNLYEHVTLSPRTLEIVIAVCAISIIGLIAYAVMGR